MRDSATLRFLLAFTIVWTFGIFILNISGQQYQINAIEKFTVFAQMVHRPRNTMGAPPDGDHSRKPDVDMSTTATIPAIAYAASPKESLLPAGTTRLPTFEIVFVTGDRAILKTRSGIIEVKVGDTLPGAGRVLELMRQKRAWIIMTEKGAIFETGE